MVSKHVKRSVVHGCHIITIPGILFGLGVVSWPLSQIEGLSILGPIGVIAAVIEFANRKEKWFE